MGYEILYVGVRRNTRQPRKILPHEGGKGSRILSAEMTNLVMPGM
jgi:hypothetical protein